MKFDERVFDRLEPNHFDRFINSILRHAFRKSLVKELETLYDFQIGKNYTEILEQWVTKAR